MKQTVLKGHTFLISGKRYSDITPVILTSSDDGVKPRLLNTIRMPGTQMPLMSPSSQGALCLTLLIGMLERKAK